MNEPVSINLKTLELVQSRRAVLLWLISLITRLLLVMLIVLLSSFSMVIRFFFATFGADLFLSLGY